MMIFDSPTRGPGKIPHQVRDDREESGAWIPNQACLSADRFGLTGHRRALKGSDEWVVLPNSFGSVVKPMKIVRSRVGS
jgi:hypothetical protein